ncbi:nucleolar protein 4-like isoform X1 [Syngnathoides biaculeatus]|uniref:nucleolar protein 4-like isoform X1 n=1 Tax=Syngnathoides biaculeatus TaxID=300417 RepID=UPI002ADE497B|nr:nucleolar protein 4-like isoform X1 [Syngnathoides biaculeatus]
MTFEKSTKCTCVGPIMSTSRTAQHQDRDPGLGRTFRQWCLRTYAESGKTKTVTRRKYDNILHALLHDDHQHQNPKNAKFKVWIKSKGFQVGTLRDACRTGSTDAKVLLVPVKTMCADGASLKRVAVVEDFYDIIFAMHVKEVGEPGKAPWHVGQKKTYKAIAEMYAFLPREAVTRFLMSCGECQKRMHAGAQGSEGHVTIGRLTCDPISSCPSENDMPEGSSSDAADCCDRRDDDNIDDASVSGEDKADMSEPSWLAADPGATSQLRPAGRPEATRRSPTVAGSREDDDDSSSESGSGLPTLTPPSSSSSALVREVEVINGNCGSAPLDFSTPASSSSEDRRPVSLSELPPQRLALAGASHLPVTVSAAAAALLGALHPNVPEELRRKYPLAAKPPLAPHPALPGPHARTPHTHAGELRLDRDYGGKSPVYSSGGSYDSVKMEASAEDLSAGRLGGAAAPDDDDDEHDEHDDSDKINDTEGVDPERLKAFNMFVRLFVDENLDRMVPISKQPKEKIQAIIESCSRQFPEFQERARKRIRTYLKSCRRMKRSGMETRPTPPHLTSAMAENILAAACESESRNAAKRMRLDAYHDEPNSLDKLSGGGGGSGIGGGGGGALREPASLVPSTYSLAAPAFPNQESQVYINGAGLSYGYRGYLGAAVQHPVSLTTGAAPQSNGPTDLSMKSLSSSNVAATANHCLGGRGGGGASAQLSQPEIAAVRQLVAGYRESAAFLLRSADELENLILQQN